ncbi:hypothetical protein I9W82_004172 [Candida metapsilosis]|uniref:HTH CENPB-type domain-containing protein n=1 Tax=Candida metapsilosis TaxID=273372 RepID=A0A8H7ZDP5_9ASCO|nr:hypothetical protein I9W82_004172 [Candida metapsilosis]
MMTSKQERATLAQKIQVLDYFHSSGSSQLTTVNKFKTEISISKSSLSDWLKREDNLRHSFARQEYKLSKNSRRTVKFKYEKINRAMDALVLKRLEKSEPISEPILREHWAVYAHQYGVDDPKRLVSFSHGWLNQFKKRHGLRRAPMSHRGSLIQRPPESVSESEGVDVGSVSDNSDNGDETIELGESAIGQPVRDKVAPLQVSNLPPIREKPVTLENERSDKDKLNGSIPQTLQDDVQLRRSLLAGGVKSTSIPHLFDLPVHNDIRRLFLKRPSDIEPLKMLNNVQDSDSEAIQCLNKRIDDTGALSAEAADSTGQSSTIDAEEPEEITQRKGFIETIDNGTAENQEDIENFVFSTATNFFQTNAPKYPSASNLFQKFKDAFLEELRSTKEAQNKRN